MKVLMIGATGKFAHLVLPELIKNQITIRALVRDTSKAEKARRLGADETVIGNLLDVDSLVSAANGVDGVFHINPQMEPDEDLMGLNMVKAAQAANVKKFVFSGVYHPSLSMRNHRAKAPIQEALYQSTMDFTILQPASFFQDLAVDWPSIVKNGTFSVPYSATNEMAYVDYRDVAQVAARAFVDPSLSNGTFELSSAPVYTRQKVAHLMSEILGKPIQAGSISFAEWSQRIHLEEGPVRDGLEAMFAYYDQYGFRGGNDLVLKAILGREPTSLKSYLNELTETSNSIHG